MDADGRLIVAGQCVRCGVEARNASRLAVWRFSGSTLALDTSFGTGGVALDPNPQSRALSEALGGFVDRQGRLLIFGYETVAGANSDALLVRLTSNGALDTTFAANGRLSLTRARLGAARGVFAFAAASDERGYTVLVNDGGQWSRESQGAWAVRVTEAGALDESFGERGGAGLGDVEGCFDLEADGGDFVLACMSPQSQPQLLRLDGSGRLRAWPSGARGVAEQSPRRFEVRALGRDSLGGWVVSGAVSPTYADGSSTAVSVRFSQDGAQDLAFGFGGISVVLGLRSTFAFSFSGLATTTCEDRLVVGGNIQAVPAVSFSDGDGRVMTGLGELGTVLLPPSGTVAAVAAVLRGARDNDLLVVASHASPSTISLHRLLLQ